MRGLLEYNMEALYNEQEIRVCSKFSRCHSVSERERLIVSRARENKLFSRALHEILNAESDR